MPSVIESNETAIPPKERYFTEAAKRMKKEGASQFEELHFSTSERLRSLAGDPWADHAVLDRLPLPIREGVASSSSSRALASAALLWRLSCSKPDLRRNKSHSSKREEVLEAIGIGTAIQACIVSLDGEIRLSRAVHLLQNACIR